MSARSYDMNALVKSAAMGLVVLLVLAVVSQLDCIQCIAVCGTIFVLGAIGANYARMAKQNGVPAETVPSALFGGLAAALASAIPSMLVIGLGTSILCIPFFLFIALIPAFMFGAIGGTLYAMSNS